MPKREKVPASQRPASPGQIGNLIAKIAPLLDYTSEEAEKITKDPETGKKFVQKMRRTLEEFRFTGYVEPFGSSDLDRWRGVYRKLFGKTPDLSKMRIPAPPLGVRPVRLIVVAQELVEWTGGEVISGLADVFRDHFPIASATSGLDEEILGNDRDPKDCSYAIWVRDIREADDEFADMSANDLAARGHRGVTLLERLLMEADYFWERGEHLDQEKATRCVGTRYHDGGVPGLFWRVDESGLNFEWGHAASTDPGYCSRKIWA